MKKLLVMKPFLWALLLFLALPQTASAYYVSLYIKDVWTGGAYFEHTDAENKMVAKVSIPSFTGSVDDYMFWIGNNGTNWEEDKSKEVELKTYFSGSVPASGSMVTVTFYITASSSATNYGPHDVSIEASCAENLKVSLHKGDTSHDANFVQDGEDWKAEVTISNYNGTASDYQFWIGNGGWESGISDNASLSTYLTGSCNAGKVKITMYADPCAPGTTNYGPTNVSCEYLGAAELGPCDQWAEDPIAIPAGTVIYFDNSAQIFEGAVWLAITGHDNLDRDYPAYVPKKDVFVEMQNLPGTDVWLATVPAGANLSAGRLSFWNKNMQGYSDVYEAHGFYNLPFTSTANKLFKPSVTSDTSKSEEWCYNSGRKTYASTKGQWGLAPDIAGVSEIWADVLYVTNDMSSFTLYAATSSASPATNITATVFEYSLDGGDTWAELAALGALTSQYTVTDYSKFGDNTEVLFRATITLDDGGSWVSRAMSLGFEPRCGANKGGYKTKLVEVYKDNFGTVGSYKGRKSLEDMVGYKYSEWPQSLDDGEYALVADPYWCGAGNDPNVGDIQGATPQPRNTGEGGTDVDKNWYRGYLYPATIANPVKFRDHTINEQRDDAPEYGLCLMINYSGSSDPLAYEHELTASENAEMVPGATVRLTAHIASIAKSSSGTNVTMSISIDFKAVGQADYTTLVSREQLVNHKDNWYAITTEPFTLGKEEGTYRIRIFSSGETGLGNDVVIDDIRLVACQPIIDAYMEWTDASGKTMQDINAEMKRVDDKFEVDVPEFDTGLLGENPGVMLFTYKNGKYKYVEDLSFADGRYSYPIDNSFITTVPQEVQFVAIATTEATMQSANSKQNLIRDIESGSLDPENTTRCYRSDQVLTLSVECKAAPTISIAEGYDANICAENLVYPKVDVAFDHFVNSYNDVQYSIVSKEVGGSEVATEWQTITETEFNAGKFSVDLDEFATAFNWAVNKQYQVSVSIKEIYNNADICTRTSETPVTFYVRAMPALSEPLTDTEMCQGDDAFTITRSALLNANSAIWQVKKSADGEWENAEGSNDQASYTIPSTAENGWQYRLELMHNSHEGHEYSCGPVYTDPLTLSVMRCDDLTLTQTISSGGRELCPGDEFTVTWKIVNNSSIASQDGIVVVGKFENEAKLPSYLSIVGEPKTEGNSTAVSDFSCNSNIVGGMQLGSLASGDAASISYTFRYSENGSGKAQNISLPLQVWLASLGGSEPAENNFCNYEDQTNVLWKRHDVILFKAKSPVPVTVDNTTVVNTCQEEGGSFDLSSVIDRQRTEGVLNWYADKDLTQKVDDSEVENLDISQKDKEYTYYVTNTLDNQCESDPIELSLKVWETPEAPQWTAEVKDGVFEACARPDSEDTFKISDLLVPQAGFSSEWYEDEELSKAVDPQEAIYYNVSETFDKTYYCLYSNEHCKSEVSKLRVVIRELSDEPVPTSAVVDGVRTVCAQDPEVGAVGYLSNLIQQPHGKLIWYSDADLQNEMESDAVSIATPGETDYWVVNTDEGKCPSLPVKITVKVRAYSTLPEWSDLVDDEGNYDSCMDEDGSLDLNTLVKCGGSSDCSFTWYRDAQRVEVENPGAVSLATPGYTTYYVVATEPDKCPSTPDLRVGLIVRGISPAPVFTEDVENGVYEICQAEGVSLNMAGLVDAEAMDGNLGELKWYSDAELANEVTAQVALATPGSNTYWVTNQVLTPFEMCVSEASELTITVKELPAAPEFVTDSEGRAYAACPEPGSIELSDLATTGDEVSAWYAEDGSLLSDLSFDTALSGTYRYYASRIVDGCESEKAEVLLEVFEAPQAPEVSDYNECPEDGTMQLADLTADPAAAYEWFDADMQALAEASFSKSETGSKVYNVRLLTEEGCPSQTVPVSVNIKNQAVAADLTASDTDLCPGTAGTLTATTSLSDNNMVFTWYSDAELGNSIGTGATLQITGPEAQATYYVTVKGDNTCENLPGDAAEADVYAIAPIDNIRLEPVEERIGMGKETEKALTVEPTDAYYTAVWTANGQVIADPDSYFPAKPYDDVEYKVVVTDECGNEMEASAITKVVWPTIITPQNADGKNDDFLVGMQEDIHLEIFDRWGNVVFSGNDGWSQAEAAKQQPGVYYYIATLPDGTAKQGTIEVYK